MIRKLSEKVNKKARTEVQPVPANFLNSFIDDISKNHQTNPLRVAEIINTGLNIPF